MKQNQIKNPKNEITPKFARYREELGILSNFSTKGRQLFLIMNR